MKLNRVPILAVLCAGSLTASAQQPGGGDPFVKGGPDATVPPAEPGADAPLPAECLVRMEIFTLPQADGREAMRRFPKQADLYAWLGAELENEKSAVKLAHLSLVRVRGGQRSKVEEIAEYPYPTEFDPPQIPQSIGIGFPVGGSSTTVTNNPAPTPAPTPKPAPSPVPQPAPAPAPAAVPGAPGVPGEPGVAGSPGNAVVAPGSTHAGIAFAPWPYTPTTPTSFSVRNTGWTTEIDLTIGADGYSLDINLAPEHIKFCGLVSQSPNGEIMHPTFETSRYSGTVATTLGQPTFVGTLSPAIAAGVQGGNTDGLTRLLFITPTNPR